MKQRKSLAQRAERLAELETLYGELDGLKPLLSDYPDELVRVITQQAKILLEIQRSMPDKEPAKGRNGATMAEIVGALANETKNGHDREG
jgi:hypothetical protein